MKESKRKICKIPKCNKEVYKDHGVLCGYHNREIKNVGKKGSSLLLLSLLSAKLLKDSF